MILKALYDYYERKGDLPRKGMELKEIGFLIVIDKEGNFVRFEDRRIDRNKAQSFLVKKHVNKTSAPLANYLYDNSAYVLGYSEKGDGEKYFDIFKAKVKSILQKYPHNDDIKAIDLFYKNDREALLEIFKQDVLWNEIEKNLNKKFSTFSFLIEGESTIVASKTELINTDDDKDSEGGQMCLVSGMRGNIVETTTATMIPGSLATAKLVSFQVSSGYDSYGKNKGYNAPISEDAEFAYTTALNHLLRSDSQNKFIIGNRTFVFWASKDDEAGKQAEESLWDMLGFKDNDDPDKNIINVRKAFESIYSGSIKTTLDDRFYILGLAPNSARIAVTYWADIPLKDFSEMILRHFKDMEIVDTRKEKKPYFGLHSLLATVSLEGKSSNVSPNLPDAVVKSIFQGLPYPQTLFASCIRRIRAEQSISITRAAILKAYLNRLNDNNNNKLTVMLDTSNTNQGYLCGRLFAVLDKIQDDANNQRSIKERYINSASATPAAVFSTILNLSLHHSAKLNEGRSVYYEKIKQEIVDKISADGFPAHLDLQDQGRFFVGYYHQMQWFYTKNSDKEVDYND
jgi:CRISPR-associated protein Csd1